MNDTMRIGLWGCGVMGRSLAQALWATGAARLAAVHDARPEVAAALARELGAQAVGSAEALLGTPGLDGVMIALPPDLHAPATEAAAQAGLDILVEKPMSVSVAGCRAMLAAAERHHVQLMVGQVLRYYEPYRAIQRWTAQGRHGRLYAATIWRISDGRRIQADHWRASRARSGGYLLEVSVHELDMLRCLLGAPRLVSAVALKRDSAARPGEWSDYIALQIRFADGGAASYEGGAGSYVGRYGFRLYYDDATLTSEAAFDRQALQIHGPDGAPPDPPPDGFSDEHPVQAEVRAWLAALRGEAPIAIPGQEGLASVALAEAAYRSAETGQPVLYSELL